MKPIEPKEEIRFAAKTGFLTKSIWKEFFATGGERWQRECWRLIAKRGLFEDHPSSFATDTLVLDRKNKFVKSLVGDDISKPPFAAQLDHDEIVARSMLRLLKANSIGSYLVEPELKRLFPVERRRRRADEKEKYPDAIVSLDGGQRIALELELTLKSRRRYRHILRTYRLRKDVDQIIFIVRSESIFNAICEAMNDTVFPEDVISIGFVWLEEWTSNPLTAEISYRTRSTTWQEMNARAA